MNKNSTSDKITLVLMITSFLLLICCGIWTHISFNMWLYKDVDFNWNSATLLLISSIIAFVVCFVAIKKEKLNNH